MSLFDLRLPLGWLFVILGVLPDTYTVLVTAKGYQPASDVAIVLPGEREKLEFALHSQLQEIARVKKAHPGHALFVSLMVESTREAWQDITRKTQDAGADGPPFLLVFERMKTPSAAEGNGQGAPKGGH